MYEFTSEETPAVAGISRHLSRVQSAGSFERLWRRRRQAQHTNNLAVAGMALAALVVVFFYVLLALNGPYPKLSFFWGAFHLTAVLLLLVCLGGAVADLIFLASAKPNDDTGFFGAPDTLPLPGRQFLEALTRIQAAGNRLSIEETGVLTAYLCALQRTDTLSRESGQDLLDLADMLEDAAAGKALRYGCPPAEPIIEALTKAPTAVVGDPVRL